MLKHTISIRLLHCVKIPSRHLTELLLVYNASPLRRRFSRILAILDGQEELGTFLGLCFKRQRHGTYRWASCQNPSGSPQPSPSASTLFSTSEVKINALTQNQCIDSFLKKSEVQFHIFSPKRFQSTLFLHKGSMHAPTTSPLIYRMTFGRGVNALTQFQSPKSMHSLRTSASTLCVRSPPVHRLPSSDRPRCIDFPRPTAPGASIFHVRPRRAHRSFRSDHPPSCDLTLWVINSLCVGFVCQP